jgi:hypothetical protein
MMAKQSRHQSVVNRHSDEGYSEDHWLREFENKLQSTAVQPRGNSLYDQITSIMNTKSKYPSVQAAVDDMMHRSGLSTYLENVKESQEKIPNQKTSKTAQLAANTQPDILKVPGLQRTLENIIKETRGNLPISAIIARLQSMFSKDTPDEKVWEDERLLRLVSQLNLQAKTNNPSVFENYDNLGKGDHSTADSDIDASNTDAFNALMPAKI